jgi:beta-glucosidase
MDYVGTRTSLYGTSSLMLEPQTDASLHLVWNGKSTAWFKVGADKSTDISRESNGAMMLAMTLKLNSVPSGVVTLGIGSATVPITDLLKAFPAGSYAKLAVPLSCFAAQDLSDSPTIAQLETSGEFDISVSEIRIIETQSGAACPKM